MKNANVLNNPQLLSEIQQYQTRKSLQAIVGPQNIFQVDNQQDLLYKELNYEQERQENPEDANQQLQLNFGHLTQIMDSQIPTIKIADYIIAKDAIKKTYEPLNVRQASLPKLIVEQLLEKLMMVPGQQQNHEENCFYSRIQNNYDSKVEKNHQEQTGFSKNSLEDQQKQIKIDEKLQKLAEHYGIDYEYDKKVDQKQKMYGLYQKKSNQLVGQVIEEARRKHLIYIKKANDNDKIRLNRQKQRGLKVKIITPMDQTQKRQGSLHTQSQNQSYSQSLQLFQSLSQSQTQIQTREISQRNTDKQIEIDKSQDYFLSELQSPQTMTMRKSSQISFFQNKRNCISQHTQQESSQKLNLQSFQGKLKSLQSSLRRDEILNNIERDELQLKIQRMQSNIVGMSDRIDFDNKKTTYGFSLEKLQPQHEEETRYKKIQHRDRKKVIKTTRNE